MSPHAIWTGKLTIRKHELPVKLYSAVEDRQIHFHLLHSRDRTRVQQRMVDPETGDAVDSSDTLKAFEAEPGLYVTVTDKEFERARPKPRRDVAITRFIPSSAIDPQLYDRPYYLGPSAESATDYFALAQALEKKQRAGIASWVMRNHSYRGALHAHDGYLILITLRHADEVVPVGELEPPGGPTVTPKEKNLALRLLEELSGRFQPGDYRDEYQARIHELIESKRTGKKLKRKRASRKPQGKSLMDSLEKSLRAVRNGRA